MRRTKRDLRRDAFTLLEMLLVLALVVTIVTLTMPALATPLNNHRLRSGADQVRAEWAKARTLAMEHGRTYVFRYSPGTDTFSVAPWLTADDYLESDELSSLGIDASGESLALDASLAAEVETLPENVVFVASETTADLRAETLVTANPNEAATVQETPPIFFYPDGTTSTAKLVLANQQGRFVNLTMRGLTGVVHVSGLLIAEELEP